MNGLRVVLTVPSLGREFGGPAGKARDLSAALRELGHRTILAGAGAAPGALGLGGLGRFHGTPVPRTLAPLRRAVRNADIVHVLGLRDPVGTAAAIEARRRSVPFILEPVGMFRRQLRSLRLKTAFDVALGGRIAAAAGAVIATSGAERDELTDAGIASSRVRVRMNGVRFDELLPLPAAGSYRAANDIPSDVAFVVTLARFSKIKGLPVLVRALAQLPQVWALVAGPDERDGALEELRALRAELGLGQRLALLPGGLWGREKAQVLSDADLFCLPSAYESFGTAAAEAAGVGLPVVCTEECGVAEVLDSASSFVVRHGDAGAFAAAIGEAIASEEAAEAARKGAGELRDRLEWRRLALEQVEIYRSVL